MAGFNPRARVGRDPESEIERLLEASFNPRARVGRDIKQSAPKGLEEKVSIHAPAWGAT